MPPDDPLGLGLGDDGESVESQAAESQAPEPDPEAPYGYTVKGEPRKSPAGRRPSPHGRAKRPSGAEGRRRARERAQGPGTGPQAPPRPPGAARKPAGSSSRRNPAAEYAAGLEGLTTLLGSGLWGLGAMTGNVAYQLDAAALLYHGPAACQGLGKVCANDPRLAAIADKLITAGPYAEAILPVLAIGAQFSVNHGALPPQLAVMFGALPPEELLNRVAVMFGGTPTAAPQAPPAAA